MTDTITPEQYRARPRHKYGAKTVERDGQSFASKAEARYFDKLAWLQKAGQVVFFLRQPRFETGGGTKYTCDFQVFWADGTVSFVDVKGMRTKEFIRAKKMVEARYPVTIEVVK